MKRAFYVVLSCSCLLLACGSSDEAIDDVSSPDTVVITPPDYPGEVLVVAPAETNLSSWAPSPIPQYGPSNSLSYHNSRFHIFNGTRMLATGVLGTKLKVAKGSWTLVLNDTKMPINVAHNALTTVYAGRVEVYAVSSPGTFVVMADNGAFTSGFKVLPGDIPMGKGLNLLPGPYTIKMTYQGQSLSESIVIQNAP